MNKNRNNNGTGSKNPKITKPSTLKKVLAKQPSKKTSPTTIQNTNIHTKLNTKVNNTVQSTPFSQSLHLPLTSSQSLTNPLLVSTTKTIQHRQFRTNTIGSENFSTLSSAYQSANSSNTSSSSWNPYAASPTDTPQSSKPIQTNSSTDDNGFAKKKQHKRFRGERQDPLTALLSTLSYSYLARTAAPDMESVDYLPGEIGAKASSEMVSQLPQPVNATKKQKKNIAELRRKNKKAATKPLSSALELDSTKIAGEASSYKLRSNVVSAEAVTKSVNNVFRQFGVNQKALNLRTGIDAILQRAIDITEANAQTAKDDAEAVENGALRPKKTSILAKMGALQHDLDLNRDKLHEDADPLGPYAMGTAIDDENDLEDDVDELYTTTTTNPDGTTTTTTVPRRRKVNKRNKNDVSAEIKKNLPALQRSIFEELDGIVEFANLHYDNVIKALSKHSLSSLYPPELLTVEFFDYRLELFSDAIQEDLGALYKAKKLMYVRYLTKIKNDGKLSQEEYDLHVNKIEPLFSATVFDLTAITQLFQTLPFQADDIKVKDLYGDEELGWTSHDTTFVRNLDNTLEDELRLVEAVHTALGKDIFSVNQFKQGLNIAAHRYPSLNVSIDKYIQQLGYEHQSISRAVDDYTELTDQLTKMGRASHLTPLQDHVLRWFRPLAESIEKEILDCREAIMTNKSTLSRGTVGTDDVNADNDAAMAARKLAQQQQHFDDLKMILPYIVQLKSTELGCIALHETLSRILNAPTGMRVIDLSLAIGRVVNTEANLLQLRQDRANFQRLRRYYPGAKLNEQVIRRAVNNQNKKTDPANAAAAGIASQASNAPMDVFGHQQTDENSNWSDLIQAKVGSFLIKHMLQSSSIRQQLDQATGKLVTSDSQFYAAKDGGEIEVPAFVYEHRQIGQNFVGYLTCHKDVRRVIDRAHTDVQALAVRLLPMVVPPRPWRGIRDGGYLSVPSSIIRSKGSRKQVQAVDASDIKSVQDSLNYLGRVAWAINPHVLNVIEQAWSEGGGLAAMPSRRDIPVPPQPTLNLLHYDEKKGRYFTPSQAELQLADKQGQGVNPEQLAQQTTQWRQWQRDTQRISQYNADLHSLRCDLTLRLNQAKQLAANPVYFPLNMDFRGRAYPIPPHLNHLGADLARALLLFHHKKPLGPKGLYWLKAHLAAQFGVDKVSFDDRVKYVEENLELVKDTATRPMYANVPNPHYGKLRSLDEPLYPIPREVQQKYARVYIRQQMELENTEKGKKTRMNHLLSEYEKQGLTIDLSIEDDPNECVYPLDGERDVRTKLPWWQLADSPWQALSTCSEIVNAMNSPDPAAYETGLPVHQDGSCNGLQHYAALGRDFAGGSRVNLTKSDKPQDVYSHVLFEVKRRMEQDIKENDNPLAKMLLPYMARKVVKQTVMTSVYGVTFIGARDQILKQLRDLKDVPWDEASALVLQQQVESRKKYLTKQSDIEQRNKQRQRNAILKTMTEAERVEFLRTEMLEQTLANDADDAMGEDPLNMDHDPLDGGNGTVPGLDGEPDQEVMVEGGKKSSSKKLGVITRDEDGVIRTNIGSDKELLMTQRQAQEAAMRASSIYLARLTLTSLGTVFSAATRIMSWLTECAGIISKQEQPVSWITPMQLPVVQHYRLISKYQVKTLNQTVTLHHDNDTLPVSPQRQRAAFPPNFVHSLDATHMMLTAAQCAQHGLVFSSVHDSYWTHPGDVDKMNSLLRDRFIHLYSGTILEDLRESFVLRYPTAEFPPLPERGDLDLEEVRNSPYFFN